MKLKYRIISFLSLSILVGCEKNESLMPPSNASSVKFDVEIPDNIDIESAKIMYRSFECEAKKPGADGRAYSVPGYSYLEKPFEIKSGNGIYHLSVPKDGGGECKWALSNVTVNIRYKLNSFVPHADDSAGVGFIIMFDGNAPQQYNGVFKKKSGDFTVDVDLYPWLNESFIPKHVNRLWLYGEELNYTYKATDTDRVLIKPRIHSDLLTRSQGPKIKNEEGGNYLMYKYPDGSVDLRGNSSPDFNRLQKTKNNMD